MPGRKNNGFTDTDKTPPPNNHVPHDSPELKSEVHVSIPASNPKPLEGPGKPCHREKQSLSSRNVLIQVLGQDCDGLWVPKAVREGVTRLTSVLGPGGGQGGPAGFHVWLAC